MLSREKRGNRLQLDTYAKFEIEFPELHDIIFKDKQTINTNMCNYQKWESDIMINGVFKEFIKQHKIGLPVHDCLMVPAILSAETAVKDLIEQVILKKIGIKPIVTKEN